MLTYYMFTKQNNLYKLWLPFFSYLLSSHGKICLTTEWININMGVEPPKSNTRLDHTVYNQTEEIIWFDHFFMFAGIYHQTIQTEYTILYHQRCDFL